MLTGKELGAAIGEAITKKGVSKVKVAQHFGVKGPSVHGWIDTGTISKDKLPALWEYFSDVVGPEHWGLNTFPGGIAKPAANHGNTSPAEIKGRVPLISWTTAGNWGEIVDNFQPGDADEWISTTANIGPYSFALKIDGNSMEPKIPNGSTVIVDPDGDAKHRSIVIVRQNHDTEATCKRLIIDGGEKILMPHIAAPSIFVPDQNDIER